MMKDTKDQWICMLDIDNTQQDFAKCLYKVLWLEEISKTGSNSEKNELQMDMDFYISRASNLGINNIYALLEQENYLLTKESRRFKKITSDTMLLAGLNKEPNSNCFFYYIRIKLNEEASDITELQHLILLLQTVPSIQNRVAVRLLSVKNATWKTEDFFRVSHFLCFVQQKYNCFYACYDDNLSSLRPLLQSTERVQSSFLPLLEVNSLLCQTLSKTWFLKSQYHGQNYDKLYTAITPIDSNYDSMTCLLFQIGLRMLFKNISGRQYRTEKRKQELLEFLCKVVQDMQGITALDMLLFGAMTGDALNKELNYEKVKALFGKIQELSLAVSQVLENIINHSERGQGVFTFRIQKKVEYLETHYPSYVITDEKGCVELLIADSNRNDGIVQHFLNSNKADGIVKELSEKVSLSHLFGDYRDEEMKKIWQKAYKKRPEMCHGLKAFVNGVRRLDGAVRVRSAPVFKSENSKDTYYYNGHTENNYVENAFLNETYIPGTQFSIALNRLSYTDTDILINRDEDWAFDFNKLVYATTYCELAQVLAFENNVYSLELDEILSNICFETHTQDDKDAMVIHWKEWFNSKIHWGGEKHRRIYTCDLEAFCEYLIKYPEIGEPFCKGFLSSRFFVEPKHGEYSGIIFQNPSALFSKIFAGTARVVIMQDAFDLNYTCVYFYPKRYKGEYLPYCATTLHELLHRTLEEKIFPRVFPYTLFLKDESDYTLFEQELIKQANISISDTKKQGFKIEQTHMRLGNKVHLDTFYEMALFFENPNYAYYTAFLILQSFLKNNLDVFENRKNLIFYGYASYSRAIVWAMIQILKQYQEVCHIEKFPSMEFVVYQNDLKLESEQPQIQMYYSNEEWQRNPNTIWNPDDTTVVMIVPISSSMTTFNKMIVELYRETKKKFRVTEKYTAFWVRNKYSEECLPTDEEKDFWQKVDVKNKIIFSKLVEGEIRYLVSAVSEWSSPLKCKKCFPNDPIFEYPLVETDPTSTVPTQQFYSWRDSKNASVMVNDSEQELQNDRRITRLKSNLVYGHVSQGHNHYQYYIKTKVYFQQERIEVAQWLKNLREQAQKRKDPSVVSTNCINVLIIPQQTNNVEFGQFVYEHFFLGCAECVIINTEKEFRSNLYAEYSGLFNRLRAAREAGNIIRFHYVDVSVYSGNSFNRAVSLITSCVEGIGADLKLYEKKQMEEFKIDQVFLLISRLSEDSKKMYVKDPTNNFHAYAELHISAMRTFGDSCVPCKLQNEARQYYKKAVTKSVSAYWENKIYERECVPFDQIQTRLESNTVLQEEGYRRMICTHRIYHFVHPIQGAETSSYFWAVRSFFDEILCANNGLSRTSAIYQSVNDENRIEWLAAGLKIIARPFLSYDYKMRCVVMDLYLILSEYMIKKCDFNTLYKRIKNSEKKYLNQNGNLEWIIYFADRLQIAIGGNEYEQLEFIRNNILKGLADIKSNYILRKDTIIHIARRVAEVDLEKGMQEEQEKQEKFFEHYLRSILRMTQSSSDETKSVWLEYLLQYGEEYQKEMECGKKNEGIDFLVTLVPEKIQNGFRDFLETLLVENNRPIYQAVIEYNKYKEHEELLEADDGIAVPQVEVCNLLDEYHMRNAKSFLSFQSNQKSIEWQLSALQELLLQLNEKDSNIMCYQRLGEKIQAIVDAQTNFVSSVILFGKYSENKIPSLEYLKLSNYYVLFPEKFEDQIEREKSKERKIFEQYWKQIAEDFFAEKALKKNGFYLLSTNSEETHFNLIIELDNNYDNLIEARRVNCQKIEPIYIYIPCEVCRQQALELTRRILLFRRKLIAWLENDFNNNAIAVLSEQKHLAKILSTDKIGDHAEDDFVECQQKILMATTEEEFFREGDNKNWEYTVTAEGERKKEYEFDEILEIKAPLSGRIVEAREWFLLRSYINSRISRLFRTMVRTGNKVYSEEIIDRDNYYAHRSQSVMMKPARNLQNIFFTPVKVGYIRKNYLKQMLKTIFLTVNGIPDCRENLNAGIDERLDNLSVLLQDFYCVNVYSKENNCQYAYLSEYLAIILLDCFVSALKAGTIWNQSSWGGKAFSKLCENGVDEKSKIELYRERGGVCGGIPYDYLVIKNTIYHPLRSSKKGPGMSQAAICWYIEGLWRSCFPREENYPRVIPQASEKEYIIKLPILEPKEI